MPPIPPEFAAYRDCQLCPRRCRVDRLAGQRGVCGETAVCRIASAAPHFGEEPPISGRLGSGTIFFAGCSCRCFFCQNYQISTAGQGREVAPDELLDAAITLAKQAVHNLNLVTPTHFLPHLQLLVRQLRQAGLDLPVVYNCSGYERPELVDRLAGTVDIFMPDFKFSSPELASRIIGAPDYPTVALDSLRRMVADQGFLEPFDPEGEKTAATGVLVRHLVLPGELDNTFDLLHLLRHEFGRMLPLSVMSQYRPMPACHQRGQLNRTVTPEEYEQVCERLAELDFQQVFLQPLFHDTGFVPDFQRDQPFAGNQLHHPPGIQANPR